MRDDKMNEGRKKIGKRQLLNTSLGDENYILLLKKSKIRVTNDFSFTNETNAVIYQIIFACNVRISAKFTFYSRSRKQTPSIFLCVICIKSQKPTTISIGDKNKPKEIFYQNDTQISCI